MRMSCSNENTGCNAKPAPNVLRWLLDVYSIRVGLEEESVADSRQAGDQASTWNSSCGFNERETSSSAFFHS